MGTARDGEKVMVLALNLEEWVGVYDADSDVGQKSIAVMGDLTCRRS